MKTTASARTLHATTSTHAGDDLWATALCRQPHADPDDWYPISAPTPEQAHAQCAGCPFTTACLEAADAAREKDGIWGGLWMPDVRKNRDKAIRRAATNPNASVTVIGMERRLQALACGGWSAPALTVIARERLGYQAHPATLAKVFERLRVGRTPETRIDTAKLVTALYDLFHSTPCNTEISVQQSITVTMMLAVRENWSPASAWVGVDIDDPAAVPARMECVA